MTTPIEELKIRAKKLLKTSPVPTDLLKLTRSASRSPSTPTAEHPTLTQDMIQHNAVQLKHCQRYIARQFGFADWEHARRVLSCESYFADHASQGQRQHRQGYGAFWYTSHCTRFLNHWCKDYAEAQKVHQRQGGYLLPYNRQFMVVQRDFIQGLGLDADDPIWQRIDYNWCEGNQSVRQQLAFQRIMAAA